MIDAGMTRWVMPASTTSLVSMLGNGSAPRAGFHAAPFDQVLETLQIAFCRELHAADRIADFFAGSLGLVIHVQHDSRLVIRNLVEGDNAFVPHAANAAPGDSLVRNLLGDLSVPFLGLAGHVGAPVQSRIVELLHFLHAIHEPRELLELSPLVVGRADRHIHLNGFFNRRRGPQCARPLHLVRQQQPTNRKCGEGTEPSRPSAHLLHGSLERVCGS
jgi:hypothetical protein